MKHLVPAAASAAMLLSAGVEANATTTINLAVASNFYGTTSGFPTTSPIGNIISAFVLANPSYSVVVVQNGSSASLETQITSSGNSLNVDLFLSADTTRPFDLYNNYNADVEGIPFTYAIGTLAFWSNTSTVNAANGYSTGGFTSVAVADPTKAPYGEATLEYLENQFGSTTFPATFVTYTNIDAVYSAVSTGAKPVGFIAASAICTGTTAGSVGYFPNGAPKTGQSARIYPAIEFSAGYNGTSSSQGSVKTNYTAILQSAIRVNRSSTGGGSAPTYRDPGTEAALNTFVSYLTSTSVAGTLAKYCYTAP